MNVDDRSKSFDLEAYLRGFLGSVVRFGEAAIHGQSKHKQYSGWGIGRIEPIGHRYGQNDRSL